MSEYTIKIENGKIIFDGHADDVQTCKAITNICDSLSFTNKIIEYKDGHAEFEIKDVDELRFPPIPSFVITSNNGEEIYHNGLTGANLEMIISTHYIAIDGVRVYQDNSKIILGLGTEVNTEDVSIRPGTYDVRTFSGVYYIIVGDNNKKFLDKSGLTRFWNALKAILTNKQDKLVSGTNIKTINSNSVLGSGNITIDTGTNWGDINGQINNQIDLINLIGNMTQIEEMGAGYIRFKKNSTLGYGIQVCWGRNPIPSDRQMVNNIFGTLPGKYTTASNFAKPFSEIPEMVLGAHPDNDTFWGIGCIRGFVPTSTTSTGSVVVWRNTNTGIGGYVSYVAFGKWR